MYSQGQKGRKKLKILDLGCGGGAHSWFLAREGFDTFGIDGSASAIELTKGLLKKDGLKGHFNVGEMAHLNFPDSSFDAVIDAVSAQHNSWDNIVKIHKEVFRVLKTGGWLFSMMINDESPFMKTGKNVQGITYKGFQTGPVPGDISCSFVSHSHVEELLKPYANTSLDKVYRTVDNESYAVGHFLFSGQKP